jgi:hypothetical protein
MVSKVEMAFNKLLRVYNKKKSKWVRSRDGKLRATRGWKLDSAYGGYKVAEVVTPSGAERDLFDQLRRKPADFVRWVDTVCAAKRQK